MDSLLDDKIPGLLEKLMSEKNFNEDEIISTFTKVIQACRVPRLDRAEDTPYITSDFPGIASAAEYHLSIICRLLEELCNSQTKGQRFSTLFLKNTVVSCLLVASEYSEADSEWSSGKAAHVAKSINENLCQLVNCTTLRELLNGVHDNAVRDSSCKRRDPNEENSVNYLEPILQTLTDTLNKKTWKAYAASKTSYWFILTHLDQKNLTECLAYMLPPALFIVDDWEQRNKILGLKCIHHILKNTTGSEIRWYGRAVVIYDAVKCLLHSREIKVIEILYPTIILAAEVLEADPEYTGCLRSMSSFDTIMQQLIQEMRYEQNLALRIAYSAVLPTLLNAMGILSIKWSEDVMPMCEDYLATYSGPMSEDRINILKGLQVYIRKCWPQVHVNAASILKMILRLVYDVTDQESGLDDKITEKVVEAALQVVRLLHTAAPKTTRELYEGVAVGVEVHTQCQCLLKEIEGIVSCEA